MDDNYLFPLIGTALNEQKKQRQKGYYGCLCGNDFIKAIARSHTKCPYCGRITELATVLSPADEIIQHALWRECGVYSELRADMK